MNNIYIIRTYGTDTSYIKLGYSSNIFKRLDAYFACNPLTEVIGTAYHKDAYAFEQYLHRNIESVVRKEWYTEDKLDIVYAMLAEKNIKLEKGIPIEIKPEKTELSYREYASRLKELNKEEAIELVKTIKNTTWHPLFYYGIETNNVLPTYTEARINYDKNCSIEEELKDTIRDKFQIDIFYTSAYIKTTLQKIYKEQGLNKRAKATDLYGLFEVGAERQTIKGATTRGFIIKAKTQRVEGVTTKGFTIVKD